MAKFAYLEKYKSIRTNKPKLRIRGCPQEVVANHRPVCDGLTDAHHAEVRSVCERNFCWDYIQKV